MADSQVSLHRSEELRLEKLPVVNLGWETCETCRRDMEELREGVWYRMDPQRQFLMDGEPISTADGHLVCSRKCLSQYIFEHVSKDDRQELCNLAQLLKQWNETFSPTFDTWCLRHQALRALLNPLTLRAMQTDMQEISDAIAYDDEPGWSL